MVDQEVVDILSEIKQRITASQRTTSPPSSNGELSESPAQSKPFENGGGYPSLVVLARAWDRLPPVVSNRSGAAASLELWLKTKLRRVLKWLTWEQVNFNAATHQTFLELIEALRSTEQRLATIDRQLVALQNSLLNDTEALRTTFRTELNAQRDQVERFQSEINSQRALIHGHKAEFEVVVSSLAEAQTANFAAATEQTSAAITDLVKEFRERDERLLDEQRVCFKQLSLELTESQVLQDRARRELDARVAKLEESGKS